MDPQGLSRVGKLLTRFRQAPHRNWSQNELARKLGINQGIMSDIVTGKRSFRGQHATTIYNSGVFEEGEVLALRLAAVYDYSWNEFEVDLSRNFLEDKAELARNSLNYIREGKIPIVLGLLPTEIEQLMLIRIQTPSDQELATRILAMNLVTLGRAQTVTAIEDEINEITRPYIPLLNAHLNELKAEPLIYEFGRFTPEMVLYVATDYDDSSANLKAHLDSGQISTSEAKAVCIKLIVIAPTRLARLGRLERSKARERFQQEKRAYANPTLKDESLTPGGRAIICSALAYGCVRLGQPEAAKAYLKTAKNEYSKRSENNVITEACMARTELLNLIYDPEPDVEYIRVKALECMLSLGQLGFRRHQKEIASSLARHDHPAIKQLGREITSALLGASNSPFYPISFTPPHSQFRKAL